MTVFKSAIFSGIHLALLFPSFVLGEPLNMTISGKAAEQVEMETLVPFPDIPAMDQLPLTLDGGKGATEKEIEPLPVSQAALLTEMTKIPMPSFSAIPDAPYIIQALPPDVETSKKEKSSKGKPRRRFTHWEFTVVDEHNQVWHQTTGEGTPPNPLTWDGTKEGRFVLEANRTYFSYVKLMAHGEPDRTITGESVRFLSFIYQDNTDTIIRFGERVYEREKAQFSPEAKIYLDDLAQRLSHIMSFYQGPEEKAAWKVVLYEPENQKNRGELRKKLWETSLKTMLGRTIPDGHFSLQSTSDRESYVSITFPKHLAPVTDLALRGQARAAWAVPLDPMPSLIKITESKNTIVVDMRHDRLFLPGSAYFRDQALPYLNQAMNHVKQLAQGKSKERKKILLRSYTQKLPGQDKRNDEDPKLTAVRTKVLFMIFAKAGLTH